MAALRAAGRQRPELGPAGLRAFWGGRSPEAKHVFWCQQGGEVEADQAVHEKEESSKPSLIHPLPRCWSYIPPEDLQSCLKCHIREVFESSVSEYWQQAPLWENRLKYHLLARLVAGVGHAIPNLNMHCMYRAGDVLGFYCIPVKDGTKIYELTAAELPPNLKIIWQQ